MNAHPLGCEKNVERQIEYTRSHGAIPGPKNVLVIGASAGYGLASRITAAFGCGAATIGVAYESPAKGSRTASAGWYMDRAFRKHADAAGLPNRSIIADAFAHATKQEVISVIREMMGTVDLIVYSLASGVRPDPDTGEMYRSVLKPIGQNYTSVTLDGRNGELSQATVTAASDEEIRQTVKVMGGEDWELWINALREAGVLASGAMTVAYSYIGPRITFPLYRDGTIGRAKEHLEETAHRLAETLGEIGGNAWVSINKALVTRASSVIPAVPLYLAILYRVMKEKGIHEGTIEQTTRLFAERLFAGGDTGRRNAGGNAPAPPPVDDQGRIRIDDWEMREDVQREVQDAWDAVAADTLRDLADIDAFQRDFLQIHGFGFEDIDYDADVTA